MIALCCKSSEHVLTYCNEFWVCILPCKVYCFKDPTIFSFTVFSYRPTVPLISTLFCYAVLQIIILIYMLLTVNCNFSLFKMCFCFQNIHVGIFESNVPSDFKGQIILFDQFPHVLQVIFVWHVKDNLQDLYNYMDRHTYKVVALP